MKKVAFTLLALGAFTITGFSQSPADHPTKKEKQENIYTSLKPADASPATFSTQEELDAKIQSKKNATIELIKANKDKPEEVRKLREQLWRFENAIVVPAK